MALAADDFCFFSASMRCLSKAFLSAIFFALDDAPLAAAGDALAVVAVLGEAVADGVGVTLAALATAGGVGVEALLLSAVAVGTAVVVALVGVDATFILALTTLLLAVGSVVDAAGAGASAAFATGCSRSLCAAFFSAIISANDLTLKPSSLAPDEVDMMLLVWGGCRC